MNAVVERNTAPKPAVIPTANIADNDAKLKELAIWFRANNANEERATQGYHAEMIRIALKKAEIIKEGRSLTSAAGFESWTKDMLQIGSSHAYNYIKLLENPEVVNFAVHTTGQIEIGHIFALLPKRNESEAVQIAREEIKERIDSGEKISVAEINQYKKRAEQAEKEANQARKDADEWRISAQTQQQINERNNNLIESKAQELLKSKAAEIEEKALATAAAEYQATIDSLQDTKSNLLAKLATVERTGERAQIEAEIAAAQAELQSLKVEGNQAAYEQNLMKISKHTVESVAAYRAGLIAGGVSSLPIGDNTFNLLMDAHEALDKLSRMFFDLANPPALTIED